MTRRPTTETNLEARLISDERQARVCRMYMTGSTMREIGRELGVSATTVFRDLERSRKKWQKETAQTYETNLPIKLAELAVVKAEAWDGWRKSLRDDIVRKKEQGSDSKGGSSKKSKQVRGQAGNPNFLGQIQRVIELESKLLGLLSKDVGDSDEPAPEVIEVIITTREEHEEFKSLSLQDYRDKIGKVS